MHLDTLIEADFPVHRQDHGEDDAILYALAIGLGADPVDPRQLQYVYEDGIRAFPTLPLVLAHPGFWIASPEFGVDWKAVLHGEQSVEIHRPVPVRGSVTGRLRVTHVVDKGPETGAMVYSERVVADGTTGEPIATLRSTTVCRRDGGQGGTGAPPAPRRPQPHGAPDDLVAIATLPQSALLYRLTGDRNPLHADPEVARAGGFDRPILHGLCTFGVAAHALVAAACGYDGDRLTSIAARFAAPVLPGATLVTRLWDGDGGIHFDVADEDGKVVLSRGWATIA